MALLGLESEDVMGKNIFLETRVPIMENKRKVCMVEILGVAIPCLSRVSKQMSRQLFGVSAPSIVFD